MRWKSRSTGNEEAEKWDGQSGGWITHVDNEVVKYDDKSGSGT